LGWPIRLELSFTSKSACCGENIPRAALTSTWCCPDCHCRTTQGLCPDTTSAMASRSAMTLFTLGALFFAQATADDTDWKPPSMPVAFCARLNTSPNGANFSDWQTEGLCAGFCRGNFALAVVQNKACWCTDYIPDQSSQVDSGQCNGKCPGYPWDVCGTDSLFAYLALDKKPAGTANAIGNKGPASTTSTTTTTEQTTANSPVSCTQHV
jgi:hypothetical protein